MNHKRKKRKNIRAGCLACKPHKVNGNNERAKAKEETEALIDEQTDILPDGFSVMQMATASLALPKGVFLDGELDDSDSD